MAGACVAFTLTASVNAEIVGAGRINGQLYYLDVGHGGTQQSIVLRTRQNACSVDDILYADINGLRTTRGEAARAICTAKQWFDNGKTVLGCTSIAATVGCGAAVVATDGVGAAFCASTLRVSAPYAIRRGAKDCVMGLRDKILTSMFGDRNYAAVGLGVGLSSAKWKDATEKSFDLMCSYAN